MSVKNSWIGVGRITNDLEVRVTESGKKVLNFNIAINDGTKENPHTTYVTLEAWENIAETISKYFNKGDQIIVSGRLVVRKYVDRGENRNKTSVVVESFEWGEKKRNENNENAKSQFYPDDVNDFGNPWEV